jgi:hypothetical protein
MQRPSHALRSDERGMILVIALPMAALLVGCLWYLISVGDAVLHRERLQDAADATAFESAVLHARAMNTEVGLNLLSASLSSIPAALRAIEVVATSSLSLSGEGRTLLDLALSTDHELGPRVAASLQVVHDTQLALRAVAPLLATAEATRNNSALARELGAADGAIALSYAALPVEEQSALAADIDRPWLLVAATATRTRESNAADARLPLEPSPPLAACADTRTILPPSAAALLHARQLDRQLAELAQKLGSGLEGAACAQTACASAQGGPAEAQQLCQEALSRLPHTQPVTTLEVSAGAQNGNALLQTWAIARRDRFAAEPSNERGMSLASPARPVDITPKNTAFAQAEYYFDCADSWERCAQDAAWSPRWTARLRRFERPDGERDRVSARRIASAFSHASNALDAALRPTGSGHARDYVRALFEAPACGPTPCLH